MFWGILYVFYNGSTVPGFIYMIKLVVLVVPFGTSILTPPRLSLFPWFSVLGSWDLAMGNPPQKSMYFLRWIFFCSIPGGNILFFFLNISFVVWCILGAKNNPGSLCLRKSVLGERADLFEFAGDTIELTEAAQMMNPTDGLPVPCLAGLGWCRPWGRDALGLMDGCYDR